MPWKIEPKLHTIESEGVTFQVLDYGSLLVGELDFLKSMAADMDDGTRVKQFVSFCLRSRYRDSLPDGATDEQLLEGMPVHLLVKVFNFLVYGPDGPQVAEVTVKAKKPVALTMENSSGSSSSTTLATPTLLPKPIPIARSA